MIRHAAIVIFSNCKAIHVLTSFPSRLIRGRKNTRISFITHSAHWHEALAACAAFVFLRVFVDSSRQIALTMLRTWSAQA